MSEATLDLHYGKLHKKYVDKANLGEGGDFMIAGAVLHNKFFEQLREPSGSNSPTGMIKELIPDFTQFKKDFAEEALAIQGSGWCYLDKSGNIKIIKNHAIRNDIAILIDMWEHAFILDYGSDKDKYLNNIWRIINWDIVNARL